MISYYPKNYKPFKLKSLVTKKILSKYKRDLIISKRKDPLTTTHYRFYIPNNWKFNVLYNYNKSLWVIYCFSDIYFFKFSFNSLMSEFRIDNNVNMVTLSTEYPSNSSKSGWNSLTRLFSVLNVPVFIKLKFKGKGYYIYKNSRNTITPQFNYSHRIYLYASYTHVKFLSKTSIFVFGLHKPDLVKVARGIRAMRKINIFTGRGVRFAKQIIYKKTGKVSSYR